MPVRVIDKTIFKKVPIEFVNKLLEKQSLSPVKPAAAKTRAKAKASRKTGKVRR
jgi:hypothetical protein